MHEEEQHIDIREKLLNLPKVKASDDFMNALQRKINLADAEVNQKKAPVEVKESVWVKLFGKKRKLWLVPSLGLTVVAIIIFSVYMFPTNKQSVNIVSNDSENKNTLESTPNKESEVYKKNELPGKDVANDLSTESGEKNLRSSYDVRKSYTEQPPTERSLRPVEKESERPPSPMKTDTKTIDESGRMNLKKNDEKIIDDKGKKIIEEIQAPAEPKIKMYEAEQKVKSEEKNKDGIEGSRIIEKKDKAILKKTAKSTTDSTKIDKKVLEKIMEELEKTLDEKK